MLFCLPPFAVLVLAERRAGLLAAPQWHMVMAELLVDVVGWLVFLELTRNLAQRRGWQARWSRFAALWNWSNLTGMVLTAIGALPIWFGLPQFAAVGVWVAMLVWALMVEWVAIRVGLGLPGPLVSALLVFDVALGFALDALRAMAAG